MDVLLQTAISYSVKLCAKNHRLRPFRIKENGHEIWLRPVVVVTGSGYEFLKSNPEHPLKYECFQPRSHCNQLRKRLHLTRLNSKTLRPFNSCRSIFKDTKNLKTEQKSEKQKRPKMAKTKAKQNKFSERKINQIT